MNHVNQDIKQPGSSAPDIQCDQRFGFVAIFGATNSGKSTLINCLIGSKVSIVSHKVQTTRRRLLGIMVKDQTQIAFIDTPGLFKAHHTFDQAMIDTAVQAFCDADCSLLIIDAHNPKLDLIQKYATVIQQKSSVAIIINKVDLIAKPVLLNMVDDLKVHFPDSPFFFTSALTGSGCNDLIKYITTSLPQGVWHYPPDQISDLPLRYLAAEVTREKVYQYLHQELPYSVHIYTDSWQNLRNNDIKINQTLYIERPSQKSIVLGQSGKMLRTIGQAARTDLTKIVGHTVHLIIQIKVDRDWRLKKSIQEQYGFV